MATWQHRTVVTNSKRLKTNNNQSQKNITKVKYFGFVDVIKEIFVKYMQCVC